MNDAAATTATFQEKMFAHIRDQMGDLMTDEDLKALVDTAMHKAFFEPVTIRNSWGSPTQGDPVFITMVQKELESQVRTAIQEWLKEHPEEVSKAIDNALAKGIFGLIQQHIERTSFAPMQMLSDQLKAKGVLG